MSSTSSSLQRFFKVFALSAALCLCSGVASAQERPFTLEKATVGAGLRFGSDNLNLGLGARGGYTLRQQVYIGGLFDYWFGEEDDYGIGGLGGGSASFSAWNLLAVGGYDFGLSRYLVVRPFGGLGLFNASVEACGRILGREDCIDESDGSLAAAFGGELLADFGGWHLGGELRVLLADDTTALVIGVNGGLQF